MLCVASPIHSLNPFPPPNEPTWYHSLRPPSPNFSITAYSGSWAWAVYCHGNMCHHVYCHPVEIYGHKLCSQKLCFINYSPWILNNCCMCHNFVCFLFILCIWKNQRRIFSIFKHARILVQITSNIFSKERVRKKSVWMVLKHALPRFCGTVCYNWCISCAHHANTLSFAPVTFSVQFSACPPLNLCTYSMLNERTFFMSEQIYLASIFLFFYDR
jgi:hypothetical protein